VVSQVKSYHSTAEGFDNHHRNEETQTMSDSETIAERFIRSLKKEQKHVKSLLC
jgi:hypothetical protein